MIVHSSPITRIRLRAFIGAVAVSLVVLASCGVDADAVQITEYPLEANSQPAFLTQGPDGNIWFTDPGANKIGRITPAGQVTEFGLGITPEAGLAQIADGPDGNLWFTETNAHKIGRITPQGVVTEFSSGLSSSADVYGIAAGPENKMWFTIVNEPVIGTIDTSTGQIAEMSAMGESNVGIVQGPDGSLWYTVAKPGGYIVRLEANGKLEAFGPLPPSSCAPIYEYPNCPRPESIAVGSDGNLWFGEAGGDAIGRVTPTGAIAEYNSGLSLDAGVTGLAAGSEGNIWFVEYSTNQVGRITPAGVITEFHEGLSSRAEPYAIALGSDGNLWITEFAAGKIARVIPEAPPMVSTGGAFNLTASTAIVSGSVRSRGADTHYFFQYGSTSAYGSFTPSIDNGAGDSVQSVTGAVGGLHPGTTYHYRLVAANASGTTYGADQAFSTLSAPPGVTVRLFIVGLNGQRVGHSVRVSRITVKAVRKGERVSYYCHRCQGRSIKGRHSARGAKVEFATRDLVLTPKSVLEVIVTSSSGARRERNYVFSFRQEELLPKGERCFLAHVRGVVPCPGG